MQRANVSRTVGQMAALQSPPAAMQVRDEHRADRMRVIGQDAVVGAHGLIRLDTRISWRSDRQARQH